LFEIKPYKTIIKDLHKVVSNLTVLFNDGDNDVMYTGTNKYGNRILGIIMFEDDEKGYLRYIHTLITDQQYSDFLSKKITLRGILENNESFFIVDKNYLNEETSSNLVYYSDIPEQFLPLKNSYCPDLIKEPSLSYSVSLKGNLADLHKTLPNELNEVNSKFSSFLSSATEMIHDFDLSREVYVESLMTGSFKINFRVELKQTEQLPLFNVPINNLSNFFEEYLIYVFKTLPNEDIDVFKKESITSPTFIHLEKSLSRIYEAANIIPKKNIEQQLIDTLNYSIPHLKDLHFNKSFDRIEILNYDLSGQEFQIGLIDESFIPAVESKLFRTEEMNKEDIILYDESPTKYSIRVYQLNTETGNGGAYLQMDNTIEKISLHLRGRSNYDNTIYTRSMDAGNIIEIDGIGKKVNGKVKEITVQLAE
jgi:hypothetical protein